MVEDYSVFSVQWADLPSTIAGTFSPEELLCRYLDYIKRCTLTLIRPVTLERGIEFRLIGTDISLVSFLPPVYSDGFAILPISGGILVQSRQQNRGELRFGVEPSPASIRVSLQLTDFHPLLLGRRSPSPLRFRLYSLTQGALHRLVTVRFLFLLYRGLAGTSAGMRIVNVAVRSGKPV